MVTSFYNKKRKNIREFVENLRQKLKPFILFPAVVL